MNRVFSCDDIGDGRALAGPLPRFRLAGGAGFVFRHFGGRGDARCRLLGYER
jgi:hypothetical protein